MTSLTDIRLVNETLNAKTYVSSPLRVFSWVKGEFVEANAVDQVGGKLSELSGICDVEYKATC